MLAKQKQEEQERLHKENINRINAQKVNQRAKQTLNNAVNDKKAEFEDKHYQEMKKKEAKQRLEAEIKQ